MEPSPVQPSQAGNAAEFVTSMRRLKEQSGYSLRQLEEKAASQGDVLARSTIADVLGRKTLPRADLLAAFVRACGADDQLTAWLRARERLAMQEHAVLPDEPAALPPKKNRRALIAAAIAVPVVIAAVIVLLITIPAGDPPATDTSLPTGTRNPDAFPVPSAGSWARIRPAASPEMCVTEGRDRSRTYESAIAVQLPCTQTGGPRTFLQPVREDTAYIEWEHPVEKGMGCLTILDTGPARDFLEPQDECSTKKNSQEFAIERTAATADTYRIRRAGTDMCVAIADGTIGAEARQKPCRDESTQHFLIDLNRS